MHSVMSSRRARHCHCCVLRPTDRDLSCSFERLVRECRRRGLISDYSESPTTTRIVVGAEAVHLDPDHSRMLLCNLVRLRR